MSTKSDIERKLNLKLMLNDEPTKDNLKTSAAKTLFQMGIGVAAGSVLAAVIGKPSLIVGAGATFAGNYFDKKWMPALGISMMAYSLGAKTDENSTMKSRLIDLKNEAMSKTYVDKAVAKFRKKQVDASQTSDTTNGMGSLEAAATLEELERQLQNSANEYQSQNKVSSFSGSDMDTTYM